MFEKDVHELMKNRISCRSYKKENLSLDQINALNDAIMSLPEPPFKNKIRFIIVAAVEGDTEQIKKLGTYGAIRNPSAFIIGACSDTKEALVDFGYLAELLVLKIEELGLGSCWLGGTLQKSRFADKVNCASNEIMPSAIAIGIPSERISLVDDISRWYAGSRKRKNWDQLFFRNDFYTPMTQRTANGFEEALEMLRWAPSASNKQPWRVVFEEELKFYHFILDRVGNYHKAFDVLKLPDLQKIDLGIGMAHFDLSVQSRKITGEWQLKSIDHIDLPEKAEYIISWVLENK